MEECFTGIDGFTLLGAFDNHQYYISETEATWSEAQNIAAENGVHLASMNTEEENDFLLDLIDEIVFIGLTDQNDEGNLTWDDGSNLTFDNVEEFNSENEDFGNMNFWNGAWSFDGPFTRRRYILERPCEQALTEPEEGVESRSLEKASTQLKMLSIYPNPANDNISVPIETEKEGKLEMQISNSIGEIVYSNVYNLTSGKNKIELELSNFSSGIYFVRTTLGSEVQTQKFIKQ